MKRRTRPGFAILAVPAALTAAAVTLVLMSAVPRLPALSSPATLETGAPARQRTSLREATRRPARGRREATPSTVRFRVADARGGPVPGARAHVAGEIFAPIGAEFRVPVGRARTRLAVTAPGFLERIFELEIREPEVDLGVVRLRGARAIRVEVVDRSGTAVPGAWIELRRFDAPSSFAGARGERWREAGRADARGSLELDLGEGGAFALRARVGTRRSDLVPVGPGEDLLTVVLPEEPNVRLRFADPYGEPLPDLGVAIEGEVSARLETALEARTDRYGALAASLPPGEYLVFLPDRDRALDTETETASLLVEDRPIERTLVVRPKRHLRVRVVDDRTGDPIVEHAARMLPYRPDFADFAPGRLDVRPAPGGVSVHPAIAPPADPREYLLVVRAPGYAVGRLFLRPGSFGPSEEVEVRLTPARPVRLRFEPRAPLPARTLYVCLRRVGKEGDALRAVHLADAARARSDRDWTTTDYAAGTNAVLVAFDGVTFVLAATVELPPPDGRAVVVPLEPPGSVLVAAGRDLAGERVGVRDQRGAYRPARIRGTTARVDDLAPGPYRLVTTPEDPRISAWMDEVFGGDGPEIEVRPGRTTRVEAKGEGPRDLHGTIHGLDPRRAHWISAVPEPRYSDRRGRYVPFPAGLATRWPVARDGSYTLRDLPAGELVLFVRTRVAGSDLLTHAEPLGSSEAGGRDLFLEPGLVRFETTPRNDGPPLTIRLRWRGEPAFQWHIDVRPERAYPLAPGLYSIWDGERFEVRRGERSTVRW